MHRERAFQSSPAAYQNYEYSPPNQVYISQPSTQINVPYEMVYQHPSPVSAYPPCSSTLPHVQSSSQIMTDYMPQPPHGLAPASYRYPGEALPVYPVAQMGQLPPPCGAYKTEYDLYQSEVTTNFDESFVTNILNAYERAHLTVNPYKKDDHQSVTERQTMLLEAVSLFFVYIRLVNLHFFNFINLNF